MTFHDWAAPFRPSLEQKIVDEVHYQLTDRYRRYPAEETADLLRKHGGKTGVELKAEGK